MSQSRALSVRAVFCVLSVLLASGASLPAQQPAQAAQTAPVFRTSADLVTIDAVVTDSNGKPVTDLTRDDFEVKVNGKRQTLDQVAYVRTKDQPRVMAAARAAAAAHDGASTSPSAESEASRILKSSGVSSDSVARTMAIVVDDLGLSFRSVYDIRKALHRFIDTQIEPGDLVAIIRTAGGVGALQQFTTDKRLLHLAVDGIQWDFRSRVGMGSASTYSAESAGSSGQPFDSVELLRDSLASVGSLSALEYVARGVSALPGRKSIILFSEGFSQIFDDRSSSNRIWNAMTQMLSRVNAAGVVINAIDARGLTAQGLQGPTVPNPYDSRTRDGFRDPSIQRTEGTPTLGSGNDFLDAPGHRMGAADTTNGRPFVGSFIGSQESLDFIARQTGGLAFRDNNDLNLGIQRVLDDQQGYYLLGYTAPAGAPRSGWDQDRVKVRVKRAGLQVRARQGFFGPLEAHETEPAPADPLVMAAVSPFGSGDITVRLTSLFGHDATTGSYVRSLLFIDPANLHFAVDDAGRHTAQVQMLLMAVGDNGKVIDHWRQRVPLTLTDENFRRIGERGIVVTVKTQTREPGPYQMRAAVEDMAARTMGSASQFLQVPEVGKGRLALSGVLLKGNAEGAPEAAQESPVAGLGIDVLLEPEVRVLAAGTKATYAYEIYDGLKDDDTPLQMSVSVLRDGKVVYQAPFSSAAVPRSSSAGVPPSRGAAVRTIPIAGTLTLGDNMPTGPYTLEVIVRKQDGKKLVERRQWVDFEIR